MYFVKKITLNRYTCKYVLAPQGLLPSDVGAKLHYLNVQYISPEQKYNFFNIINPMQYSSTCLHRNGNY